MAGESSTTASTMTENELEDMHDTGADPSDTKERLNQYIKWRIQTYTANEWTNTTLSDALADDFQLFDREGFEKLRKTILVALRDCLRKNGVYVKRGRGYSIAQCLMDAVKEEIPWPPDDEERPPPKQSQYYPPQQQPIPQPATQPVTPPAAPTVLQKATQSSTQPVTQQAEPLESTAEKECNVGGSSNVNTSLLPTIPRLPTMPTFGNLAPSNAPNLASSNTPNLASKYAPQLVSQQYTFFLASRLASRLASPLDYIRYAQEMEATGQG